MKNKIILQDLNSRHYSGTDGTWISDCQQARAFEHASSALLVGLRHSERRPQTVWCFGNPALTLVLSVRSVVHDRLGACERVSFVCR